MQIGFRRELNMRSDNEELRIRILDEAERQFNRNGVRFTMDDLAHALGMSKKTIYVVFRDKKQIMTETIDRFFRNAIESEEKIRRDESLTVPDKLRRVIGLVPQRYAETDLTRLYVLKDKYPSVYRHWQMRREEYWSGAEALLREGIEAGVFRPVSVPVFRLMFQSTLEQFFQNDILVQNRIPYRTALAEVANILIDGIVTQEDE